MVSTTAEITWITFLFHDIGVPLARPPQLFCDNISVLHRSVSTLFHSRSKHIELNYHFVWEKVAVSHFITWHVLSSSQLLMIYSPCPYPRLPFRCLGTNWVFILNHTPVWGGMLRIQLRQIPMQLKRIKSQRIKFPSYKLQRNESKYCISYFINTHFHT